MEATLLGRPPESRLSVYKLVVDDRCISFPDLGRVFDDVKWNAGESQPTPKSNSQPNSYGRQSITIVLQLGGNARNNHK